MRTNNTTDNSQAIPILILIGPPGCGKGTQGDQIAKLLGIPKISTGDLLREEINLGTALGKKVTDIMSSGNLVDDSTVLSVLERKISGPECARGFILDGFPRSLPQAKGLNEVLSKTSKKFKMTAIYINVSDETVINRICNRYYCTQCKTNYNKLYKNPKVAGLCDVCGGHEFAVRQDDKVEVVKNRLVTYHKQTEPVLDYYEKQDNVVSFDGNIEADALFASISEFLSPNI